MRSVKILGAGSIGNHLAHGCRERGWAVTMVDRDPAALERTRESIYPSRYGAFDPGIRLSEPSAVAAEDFDLVILGTPPDTHLSLALEVLSTRPPRVLLIEKPLCPPGRRGCAELLARAEAAGTRVLVGYNHRLTRHTRIAEQWLAEGGLGEITTLRAQFREHWGGIFAAHPWLAGPAETYLGFTERGGGALGEHSHAINIFQHFARLAGLGRITQLSAALDEVTADGAAYDRIAQLSVVTESGHLGFIAQDVVTRPAEKWLRLQGSEGFLEWQVNATPGCDRVLEQREDGFIREESVAKSRPDDFRGEIAHLEALLEDPKLDSPLDLTVGLETMAVIDAALEASRSGRSVRVDYALAS